MSREVPLEERLVDRDVLDADDPLLPFDLDDPVHEEEGIAMRQDVHDAADVHLGRAAALRRARQRPRQGDVAAVARDRKSTRLNSSHEWISYAVFCLKK